MDINRLQNYKIVLKKMGFNLEAIINNKKWMSGCLSAIQ